MLNGGYLNVKAIKEALDFYLTRGFNACCLVPEQWTRPRPSGETPELQAKRRDLLSLIESGTVRVAPREGRGGLPPLVSWILSVESEPTFCPVILVSNASLGECVSACKVNIISMYI